MRENSKQDIDDIGRDIDEVELEEIPNLPAPLGRTISMIEAAMTLNLEVLFHYCRQFAENAIEGRGVDLHEYWSGPDEIIENAVKSPIIDEHDQIARFRCCQFPAIMERLNRLVGAWLTVSFFEDVDIDDDGSENVGVFMNDDGEQSGYRWDGSTGTLYEWSEAHKAYLFVAAANGRSKEETIQDYEQSIMEV